MACGASNLFKSFEMKANTLTTTSNIYGTLLMEIPDRVQTEMLQRARQYWCFVGLLFNA
jgi:hypothetical protein